MTAAHPGTGQWQRLSLDRERAAVLLMCGFVIVWAIVDDVLLRHLEKSYGLIQFVWMRYLVHLNIVLMLWGWHRPGRIWRTKRPVYHLVRSLMMLLMPLSWGLALISGVSISFAWVVFWLSPTLAIFLAVIWLQERPSYWTWVAVILGFLGVVAILLPTIPTSSRELVMPFVMALSFGIYVVMTRSLRSEAVEARLFYTAVGVFAVLTLFVARGWITPSLHDIEITLGIGALGFVALWLIDWSLSHAPVSAASPALYLQVASVSIIEMFFNGQRVTGHALLGILLAVVAGVLAWTWAGKIRTKAR